MPPERRGRIGVRVLLGALLAGGLAVALLAGLHLYLAVRLVLEPGWAEPWRRFLLGLLSALAASLVLGPLTERLVPRHLARLLSWPASLWMGLLFLLLTLVAVSDLGLWLAGVPARAETGRAAAPLATARLRAVLVAVLALGAGAVGVLGAWRPPALRRVVHRLPAWPAALDGFRVVQICDLHVSAILGSAFVREVTRRCNALDPDLVAVTGDLVDGSVRRLVDEVAPLAALRARHGVFFVTGNHDHYSGAGPWAEVVRRLGMRVLRNQRVVIQDGGASFELAGVDDHHGGYLDGQREDLPRALAGRSPQRPLVLLAHDPTTFKRSARMGVDLQLSGHTHGGQIWPFRYLVRLAIPFVVGVHERNGCRLYVSRGTGFWGPPMRLLAPAEITEHVLRPVPAGDPAGVRAEVPGNLTPVRRPRAPAA